MNNWNLKSASSISKSDFDIFNKCFPKKILYFDDLIESDEEDAFRAQPLSL